MAEEGAVVSGEVVESPMVEGPVGEAIEGNVIEGEVIEGDVIQSPSDVDTGAVADPPVDVAPAVDGIPAELFKTPGQVRRAA